MNDNWNTPEWVLEPLYGFLGGFFSLDPCSNRRSLVLSEHRYTKRDNGLVQPWFGSVFMNPPYSRGNLGLWVGRAALMHEQGATEHVFGLVPAYTSSCWWHDHATRASAVLFYKKRISFVGSPGSPKFPSALCYFGPEPRRFATYMRPLGWVVQTRTRPAMTRVLLPSYLPHTPSLPARFVN